MLRPASTELMWPRIALELTGMGGCACQAWALHVCVVPTHAPSQLKSSSALKLILATPCAFHPALSCMCPVTQSLIW